MMLQTLWNNLSPEQHDLAYVLGAIAAIGFAFEVGRLLATYLLSFVFRFNRQLVYWIRRFASVCYHRGREMFLRIRDFEDTMDVPDHYDRKYRGDL
jgi:hypothetical protein